MSQVSEDEKAAFRQQVAAWMQANKPADPGFLLPQSFMEVGSEQQLDFLREWQYKVWSAGYLGMAWPREYGGQGVDPVFQSIADQEMRRHAVPICFNVIGLGWAGPLINDMGTEAEKARYLKGILTGEDICFARCTAEGGISGARDFPNRTTAPTWATRSCGPAVTVTSMCLMAPRSGPPWATSRST